VASFFLKAEHHLGKPVGGYGLAFIKLAEMVILTIDALHVAVRKEYRSRTFYSGNRRFLAMVRIAAVYLNIIRRPAISEFVF
jgi:hypothetical protein